MPDMAVTANRTSTYTAASSGSDGRNGEPKKDLWNTMLGSVASGKRLPAKNLIVFGGTPSSQREFLESLSISDQRRTMDAQSKIPPVANNFALGYTYYDVLDADHEDVLARISLYMLTTPSQSFASLIRPLLTPASIPNTLIVILLDWTSPQSWLRQLRQWILLLQTVFRSLSNECTSAMEDVMTSWRNRGREGSSLNLDGTAVNTAGEVDDDMPLGAGEWEDALGLPLCVVCQKSEFMDELEREQGWKETNFDLVLQYLRTVLLRHGASLIYTTENVPSSLPTLVHSSLGISSLLKKSPLKHNVIDRDKILVPPNWDSWGKIRVLRDGFDVEQASQAWSNEMHQGVKGGSSSHEAKENGAPAVSAVEEYETNIPSAMRGLSTANDAEDHSRLELESKSTDAFLEEQLPKLNSYREEWKQELQRQGRNVDEMDGMGRKIDSKDGVNSHFGPVQFNMGGIQVDADDMVRQIRNRQELAAKQDAEAAPPSIATNSRPPKGATKGTPKGAAKGGPNAPDEEGGEQKGPVLSAFFGGLLND